MEFLVTVPVDDAQFEVLERRYQTLIGYRIDLKSTREYDMIPISCVKNTICIFPFALQSAAWCGILKPYKNGVLWERFPIQVTRQESDLFGTGTGPEACGGAARCH